MYPKTRAPRLHQARPSQLGQVPGNLGLRDLENGDNVAHAQFAVPQQAEDAQAGPVAERPEHHVNLVGDDRLVGHEILPASVGSVPQSLDPFRDEKRAVRGAT